MWVGLASVNQQWPWQYSGTNVQAHVTHPSVGEGGREGGKALGWNWWLLTLFNRPGLADLLKVKV